MCTNSSNVVDLLQIVCVLRELSRDRKASPELPGIAPRAIPPEMLIEAYEGAQRCLRAATGERAQ